MHQSFGIYSKSRSINRSSYISWYYFRSTSVLSHISDKELCIQIGHKYFVLNSWGRKTLPAPCTLQLPLNLGHSMRFARWFCNTYNCVLVFLSSVSCWTRSLLDLVKIYSLQRKSKSLFFFRRRGFAFNRNYI